MGGKSWHKGVRSGVKQNTNGREIGSSLPTRYIIVPQRLLHRRPVRSVAANLDGVIGHDDTGLPAVGRTALHALS